MRVDKLTSFEAETLIRFFLNHLRPELRGRLIVELPVIYRKLLGRPDDDSFRAAIKEAVFGSAENTYDMHKLDKLAKSRSMTPRDWCKLVESRDAGETLEEALANLEEDE